MNLNYMSDKVLSKLKSEISDNKVKYTQSDPFINSYIINEPWYHESKIQITNLPVLKGNDPKDDFQNTCQIYEALKNLSSVEAADERLWAYLTHGPYWRYNIERWNNGNIQARFFFKSKGIGGLVLNGISRLWWFGKVSYDESKSDPWKLTKVLLSSQDIQTGLLQRTIGRSKTIRTAALNFFHDKQNEIDELGTSGTIQDLCKTLNLAGGACLLDAMNENQITKFLDISLNSIKLNKKSSASSLESIKSKLASFLNK